MLLRLVVATSFFEYLTYFSIWGANFLYLLQVIVFVDLAYALNITMDEAAKNNSRFHILKAIISISFLIAASFLCFIGFKYNPLWVSWVNAISLVVFLIVALLRVFP